MNKYTELIDKYLSSEMTPAEKLAFEKELESNTELKTEFETQKQILQGIERAGIKSEINKGFKKGSFKTKAGKWMIGIAIATLAVATVMVVKDKVNSKDNKSENSFLQIEQYANSPDINSSYNSPKEENLRYEMTEENNKNWGNADKQLSSQFFDVSSKKDTVIETKGGIILAIPAKSFFKNNGEAVNDRIEIEVKEALNPLDIMKAGLSTTSNGELLKTGGMFYVNARQNGENLNIKGKGIYASIPTNEREKEMMLFDGARMPDGQINWVKPKAFENKLLTVDILSLDFYPKYFLDSLKSLGYATKNKNRTDSIYYSFVCSGNGNYGQENKFNEIKSVPTVSSALTMSYSSSYKVTGSQLNSEPTVKENCEIAPSRIRAIWDKKFNNTSFSHERI